MKKELRTRRGLGSLYKRDAEGKELPANSKKAGIYWIVYQQDGKRVRQRLEKDGQPITDYNEAKAEQMRIRAPFLTAKGLDRKEREKAELVKIQDELKKITGVIAEDEIKHAQELDQALPPLSIADAWDVFYKSPNRSDPGADTLANYQAHWKAFVNWMKDSRETKGLIYCRDITKTHAGAFMTFLKDSGRSAGTYNKFLTFLTMFFKVLSQDENARINQNPFDGIKRKPQQINSRRELTIAELQKIISTAEGDFKLLLQVGTFTGLRLGDCCTLLWGEIDLARQVIRRKPRKTATRTQKAVTIGIPSILMHELSLIPEEQRTGYLLPRFASLYLGDHGTGNVTKIIQAHFHKCGIATHAEGTGAKYHYEGKNKVYEPSKRAIVEVGFHSLRHTWVSLHATAGTPAAIIQDAAGHSNAAMTQHYTHIDAEAARKVAKALDLPELAAAMDAEIIPDTAQDRLSRITSALNTAAPETLTQIEKLLNLR